MYNTHWYIEPNGQSWQMDHLNQVHLIQKDNKTAPPNKSIKGGIMLMNPKVNDCNAI